MKLNWEGIYYLYSIIIIIFALIVIYFVKKK